MKVRIKMFTQITMENTTTFTMIGLTTKFKSGGFPEKFEIMGSIKANGRTIPLTMIQHAINTQDKEVLLYLRDHESNPRVCGYVAKSGNLDLIIWTREVGFAWNYSRCCSIAAKWGHIEVLEWALRENLFSSNGVVSISAVMGGRIEVLKWLEQNNIKIHKKAHQTAINCGNKEIIEWFGTTRAKGISVRQTKDSTLPSPVIRTPTDSFSEFDIFSSKRVFVKAGKRALIGTGLELSIAEDYEVQIQLIEYKGLLTTLDKNFKEEIYVQVYNSGTKTITIKKGEKIAKGFVHSVSK